MRAYTGGEHCGAGGGDLGCVQGPSTERQDEKVEYVAWIK